MSKVKPQPEQSSGTPAPYNGQPRSENGQFAKKKQVAGLGLTPNVTRKIDGRAIRRVRSS